MVAHAVSDQQPMQPEAVAPRFEAGDDLYFASEPCSRSSALRRDKGEQRGGVAGIHPVHDDLLGLRDACRDKPGRVAQLKRDVDGVFGSIHLNRSEEHTSELQSLMRISYAVFCLKKKNRHVYTKI